MVHWKSSSCGDVRIENFSPNCLQGVVEAVARRDYGVANLSQVFFDYSFRYERPPDGSLEITTPPAINCVFSRELPLGKDAFLARLRNRYGLDLLHKPFLTFDALVEDLERITRAGALVISEVDFFHMRRHPFHGRIHDGHMMLVGAINMPAGALEVVDALFGRSLFPLSDYRECFDAARMRGRPFYLLAVDRPAPHCADTQGEALKIDLDRSLDNLESSAPDCGLRGFEAFVRDLERAAGRLGSRYVVAGFWAFMCNAMNNARFLAGVDNDHPAAADAIRGLRSHMLWLNKRWFLLNASLEGSVQEGEEVDTSAIIKGLREILAAEPGTVQRIRSLRDALAAH